MGLARTHCGATVAEIPSLPNLLHLHKITVNSGKCLLPLILRISSRYVIRHAVWHIWRYGGYNKVQALKWHAGTLQRLGTAFPPGSVRGNLNS